MQESKMERYISATKLEGLCGIMADKCDDNGEGVWSQFRTVVECSPTADVVEVKHGEFRKSEIREGEWWHTCSECAATYGSEDGIIDFNYCPNCGAKMDRETKATTISTDNPLTDFKPIEYPEYNGEVFIGEGGVAGDAIYWE